MRLAGLFGREFEGGSEGRVWKLTGLMRNTARECLVRFVSMVGYRAVVLELLLQLENCGCALGATSSWLASVLRASIRCGSSLYGIHFQLTPRCFS